MILDLNKPVEINEVSRIDLSGRGIDSDHKVELTFSKAALVGFATNLIWLYEDMDRIKQTHIHIDPLGGGIPGDQAMGFFLTPGSPFLVVQVGEQEKLHGPVVCKQIHIRNTIHRKVEIREPACGETIETYDDLIEAYELGWQNIARIKIMDRSGEDVSENCGQVVLRIGFGTVKSLATMLMVLADNYLPDHGYLLANLKQSTLQYNMGMIFSKESPDVVIKCGELGCVCDHDPDFFRRR